MSLMLRKMTKRWKESKPAPPLEEEETCGPLAIAGEVPSLEIEVPQSVYGGAVFIPLLVEVHGIVDWFEWYFWQYILLVLSFCIQFYLIVHVRNIYTSQVTTILSGDCEVLDIRLLLLCVVIFVAFVIVDLQESMYLLQLLRGMSTDHGEDEYLLFKQSAGGMVRTGGGLGSIRKWLAFLFVVLPKVAVAVLLMLYGCYFLASSASSADVLLNSLALIFILDLDELLYEVFTPCFNKRVLAAVPAYTLEGELPRFLRCWRLVGTSAKAVFVVFLALLGTRIRRCGATDGGIPGITSAS